MGVGMDSFSYRHEHIYFSSDEPGCYASLFLDAESLSFDNEASSFDNDRRSFSWAFRSSRPTAGQRLVFATSDRAVLGEVGDGGGMRVVEDREAILARSSDGAPERVLDVVPIPPPPPPPPSPAVDEAVIAVCSRMPKVSVVTCSYNRPDFLREAVESLRRQTDPDWEHLIYDDESTDRRVERILAWAAEDPRVRVWRGKSNINRPAARWNFLLDRACGRYLTVLDDDNEKLPRFVAVMTGQLDADPALDIVTCGWWLQDDRDNTGKKEQHLNLSTDPGALDDHSTCDGGAMLYRRGAFERAGYFSEAIRTNEDWDWLRRASRFAKIKNLDECLATYRCHKSNRMIGCENLGNSQDVNSVRVRDIRTSIGVRIVRPDPRRLTRSQEDATRGILGGLRVIPWVEPGEDLAVVVAPFQIDERGLLKEIAPCRAVLFLHMEDPYALAANLERVRVVSMKKETWVATCDASCLSKYQEVVGNRVVACPSLGADEFVGRPSSAERTIDVLLCGYAYPSRKRLVADLMPRLRGRSVVLVGDGWEGFSDWALPTQDIEMTYQLHARAKTAVCLHRVRGDCSDGPSEPETVNRGFMEGYLGARVFVDKTRSRHSFDAGDVVWYDGPVDLAGKLEGYLAGKRDPVADRFAEKCALLHTYRARVARILNCVRSPRYLAEIP